MLHKQQASPSGVQQAGPFRGVQQASSLGARHTSPPVGGKGVVQQASPLRGWQQTSLFGAQQTSPVVGGEGRGGAQQASSLGAQQTSPLGVQQASPSAGMGGGYSRQAHKRWGPAEAVAKNVLTGDSSSQKVRMTPLPLICCMRLWTSCRLSSGAYATISSAARLVMWILLAMLPLSMREATLTVSPNKQYLGLEVPTTDATTSPEWKPTLMLRYLRQKRETKNARKKGKRENEKQEMPVYQWQRTGVVAA